MRVRASATPRDTALVIDASTYRATLALLEGDRLGPSAVVTTRGGGHEEQLMPALARLMHTSGLAIRDLKTVVCGAGPGTFTSLRIAAAVAKGLVRPGVGADGPVLATVSSLLLIVAGAADRLDPGRYVASIDALRGDRYAALMTYGLDQNRDASDGPGDEEGHASHPAGHHARPHVLPIGHWRRMPATEVMAWARENEARVIGPGCTIDAWPEAAGALLVRDAVTEVDAATWEPEYGRLAEAQVKLAHRSAGERTQ